MAELAVEYAATGGEYVPSPAEKGRPIGLSKKDKGYFTDMLAEALISGVQTFGGDRISPGTEGWTAEHYPNEVIAGANEWLANIEGGIWTYELLEDLMIGDPLDPSVTGFDINEGFDYAWAQVLPETPQWNIRNVLAASSPISFFNDLWREGLDLFPVEIDAIGYGTREKGEGRRRRMEGRGTNPYTSTPLGNLVGVHDWTDAIDITLDLLDLGMFTGGTVIRTAIRRLLLKGERKVAAKIKDKIARNIPISVFEQQRMADFHAFEVAHAGDEAAMVESTRIFGKGQFGSEWTSGYAERQALEELAAAAPVDRSTLGWDYGTVLARDASEQGRPVTIDDIYMALEEYYSDQYDMIYPLAGLGPMPGGPSQNQIVVSDIGDRAAPPRNKRDWIEDRIEHFRELYPYTSRNLQRDESINLNRDPALSLRDDEAVAEAETMFDDIFAIVARNRDHSIPMPSDESQMMLNIRNQWEMLSPEQQSSAYRRYLGEIDEAWRPFDVDDLSSADIDEFVAAVHRFNTTGTYLTRESQDAAYQASWLELDDPARADIEDTWRLMHPDQAFGREADALEDVEDIANVMRWWDEGGSVYSPNYIRDAEGIDYGAVPPGHPDHPRRHLRRDDDLIDRYPEGYMAEDFIMNEPRVFDPETSAIERKFREGEFTRDEADALLEGLERIRTWEEPPQGVNDPFAGITGTTPENQDMLYDWSRRIDELTPHARAAMESEPRDELFLTAYRQSMDEIQAEIEEYAARFPSIRDDTEWAGMRDQIAAYQSWRREQQRRLGPAFDESPVPADVSQATPSGSFVQGLPVENIDEILTYLRAVDQQLTEIMGETVQWGAWSNFTSDASMEALDEIRAAVSDPRVHGALDRIAAKIRSADRETEASRHPLRLWQEQLFEYLEIRAEDEVMVHGSRWMMEPAMTRLIADVREWILANPQGHQQLRVYAAGPADEPWKRDDLLAALLDPTTLEQGLRESKELLEMARESGYYDEWLATVDATHAELTEMVAREVPELVPPELNEMLRVWSDDSESSRRAGRGSWARDRPWRDMFSRIEGLSLRSIIEQAPSVIADLQEFMPEMRKIVSEWDELGEQLGDPGFSQLFAQTDVDEALVRARAFGEMVESIRTIDESMTLAGLGVNDEGVPLSVVFPDGVGVPDEALDLPLLTAPEARMTPIRREWLETEPLERERIVKAFLTDNQNLLNDPAWRRISDYLDQYEHIEEIEPLFTDRLRQQVADWRRGGGDVAGGLPGTPDPFGGGLPTSELTPESMEQAIREHYTAAWESMTPEDRASWMQMGRMSAPDDLDGYLDGMVDNIVGGGTPLDPAIGWGNLPEGIERRAYEIAAEGLPDTPVETYGEGQWVTADTGYSRWETEHGTYMTQEEFIDLSYTEADLIHEGFVSVLGAQHPAPITPFTARGLEGLPDAPTGLGPEVAQVIRDMGYPEEMATDRLFQEFAIYSEITRHAEKSTVIDPFSPESARIAQTRPYDWKAFSESRGYTEAEIADYERWLDLVEEVDAKYPEDGTGAASTSEGFSYQLQVEFELDLEFRRSGLGGGASNASTRLRGSWEKYGGLFGFGGLAFANGIEYSDEPQIQDWDSFANVMWGKEPTSSFGRAMKVAQTSGRFHEGLDPGFWGQLDEFINDSNGEVQPLMGRMDPADYKHLHQELLKSDPELAAELGPMANTAMTNGKAAMLHYPNSSNWAVQNAGRYGLRLREGFDNVVEPEGERLKQGPTDFSTMTEADKVRHFMEVAGGTLKYRDPVQEEPPAASAGAR